MRYLITLFLLAVIPAGLSAQEADAPEARVHLEQSVTSDAPAPDAVPLTADADTDRQIEVQETGTQAEAAMQEPASRQWWWIVGAVVVGGLIVALLL